MSPTRYHAEDSLFPDLSADVAVLLKLIASNLAGACPSVATARAYLGWPPRRLLNAIRAGVADGQIDRWPESNAITLSPLEARRRGLSPELVDAKATDPQFRWVADDAPPKPERRDSRRTVAEADLMAGQPDRKFLDTIAVGDCLDNVGEALDAIDAYRDRKIGWEAMTRLVGLGLNPIGLGKAWDNSARVGCPLCGGDAALESLDTCSWCQRSGVDDLIGVVAPLPPDRAYVRGRDPAEAKAAYKANRRAKRARDRIKAPA